MLHLIPKLRCNQSPRAQRGASSHSEPHWFPRCLASLDMTALDFRAKRRCGGHYLEMTCFGASSELRNTVPHSLQRSPTAPVRS